MNEILAKLTEVLNSCFAKEQELKQSLGKVNEAIASQTTLAENLNIRAKQLDAREVEIKKVEDIIAMTNKISVDRAEVIAGQVELKIQRDAFIKYMEQAKNEVISEKTRLIEKDNALDNDRKAIIAAGEALGEERKNLMKNIIDQINKMR